MKIQINCHHKGAAALTYKALETLQDLCNDIEHEMADCSKLLSTNHITEVLKRDEEQRERINQLLSKEVCIDAMDLEAIRGKLAEKCVSRCKLTQLIFSKPLNYEGCGSLMNV